jgi:hypothetical protein
VSGRSTKKSAEHPSPPAAGDGLLAMVVGGGLTAYTYMQAAAQQGGGRYFVMTGLIGVGLFATCRGLMWYAKAGGLDRRVRGA